MEPDKNKMCIRDRPSSTVRKKIYLPVGASLLYVEGSTISGRRFLQDSQEPLDYCNENHGHLGRVEQDQLL